MQRSQCWRSNSASLEDIQLATERIAGYIQGMSRAEFVGDQKTRAAVEREITIIGEAAVKITAAFKSDNPDVPWRRLVRLRNFYMHAYERLSPAEVWGTASRLAPEVGRLVETLIEDEPSE